MSRPKVVQFATEKWWDTRVEIGDCWICLNTGPTGYAHVKIDGRRYMAHRAVWELLVGPIPEGMTIDHICRVRKCINPDHLRVMTQRDNQQSSPAVQAWNRKRLNATHCRNGHEWSEANTYRDGRARYCRPCNNESHRRLHVKK